MIGTLTAECLLAVTGLFPGRAPSDVQRRLALKFPQRLGARVAAFLESDKPEKFKAPELPDQKEFHDQLLEPVDTEEVAGWFDPTSAALAVQYGLLMQATREKVKAAWPTYPDPSLGIHNFDLAPDELLDVVQLFRTLDSIESVFDDLDAQVLLPDQVTAIATTYPDLYETLKQAAFEELVPYLDVPGRTGEKKNLSPVKEEQIRVLMQLQADAPIEAQQEQPPTPAAQKPGRRPPEPQEEEPSLETPSEHTAAKRLAK